jgi:ribosomal protein L23
MCTHYEVLQVSETASSELIKQRFQQLIFEVIIASLTICNCQKSKTKQNVKIASPR